MAIFGRISARQRLRRATRESLAIPAFSSPIDCTPWVTGGLWPVELSTIDPETAALADYLRADLERIARSANDKLKVIMRSGLPDAARQAAEGRVIDEARARAARRVESTVRQLEALKAPTNAAGPSAPASPDLGATQVIPAFRDEEPAAAAPAERRWRAAESRRRTAELTTRAELVSACKSPSFAAPIDATQVIPAVADAPPAPHARAETAPEPRAGSLSGRDDVTEAAPVGGAAEPEAAAYHRCAAEDKADAAVATPTNHEARGNAEFDVDRLNRLLEFVVRQEPRLNWAVGEHVDGATVVVTDLAHGWIPSGISLPAGVRLLEPGRRSGRAAALIGETTLVVTYAPGDSLRRSGDFATVESSLQPRELPRIDELGAALATATRLRDGLPRMVHAMATTAAAGTPIVDQEADVLRVHLDTARYQLMVQYPSVDAALLLTCLLLAATEAFVTGDWVSANYHLRWFQELDASPS